MYVCNGKTILFFLACVPILTHAQIYQSAQNSTAAVVRDPARQSSTEIDAVINNPAGTAFLNDGWSFSLNGRLAYQTLDISSFDNHVPNSSRDIIPTFLASYKKDNLTFSFSFANEGGYGKWTFAKEPTLSHVFTSLNNSLFEGYKSSMSQMADYCNPSDKLSSDVFVDGSLYNYSFRLGVSWKISDKWSVYGGIRTNFVTDKTKVYLYQGVEKSEGVMVTPKEYFTKIDDQMKKNTNKSIEKLKDLTHTLNMDAEIAEISTSLQALTDLISNKYQAMANTPSLIGLVNERTNGWGISPIFGADFQTGAFNFGIRYEPETKIHVNNGKQSYHLPGIISGGASWQVRRDLKVSVGGSWSYQNKDSWYQDGQNVSFDNESLIFNMGTTNVDVSHVRKTNGITNSFDCSASLSYSPIDRLTISMGYTFVSHDYAYKTIYLRSLSEREEADIVSGGFCYKLSDKVQFDFGVSKLFPWKKDYNLNYENIFNHQLTTMSAGININL